MNSCITCKEAIEHCMSTHTFAFAHLYGDEKIMDMHIHNCCEVYYSISGGKQFLIDHCLYDIRPGDLFLINQFESHHLTQIDQQTHERIILSIDPEYLSKLSTGVTDLGHCFSFRDTRMPHQIHLSPKEQNRFMYFIHELHDDGGMGEDLLDQAIFLELMVFLNRAFAARCTDAAAPAQAPSSNYHAQVDAILSYINSNIGEPLTLAGLSAHFFMSTSYLCRIFKEATGTTINKYITAKRITLSKSLLDQGCSVSEACEACGFNDYSNYLRAFTKAVGTLRKSTHSFTPEVMHVSFVFSHMKRRAQQAR